MEYSYCPDLERKAERALRNACLVACILLFTTSFFPGVPLPWLFWLLSAFAGLGFVIFQTYLNKTYCYRVAQDGLFEVEERTGTRRYVVCRLAQKEIERLEKAGSKEAKEGLKEQGRQCYSYVGTLKKENAYWLFATVAGEKLAVCILADERVSALLTSFT